MAMLAKKVASLNARMRQNEPQASFSDTHRHPQHHGTATKAAMSTTADLISAIKHELKANHITYAELAQRLDMAESSVKRMFSKGDMPLSRIDAICQALALDFADLARKVADHQPLLKELTQAQEAAVVADRHLLLVAICVLSQWTLEQISPPTG